MHRTTFLVRSLVSAAALVLGTAACSKKGDEADSMPKSEPIAMSMPDPAGASIDYVIETQGKTAIDMPAPKERIKAETSAAKGQLHLNLTDFTKTRGDVYIDLSTFATHTFGNDDDATQTKHARTWLQVDDTLKDPAEREKNRWVHFAIRSIDGVTAPDAKSIPAVKDGADDVRTVTLVAHGDLELHQHSAKEPKSAALSVKLHYPAGSPADAKPRSLEITSTTPFVITLAEHDVKPRDAEGILAQKAFGILGTKVADVANVSIDLRAKPAS